MPRKYGKLVGHGRPIAVPIPLDFQRRLLDWCIESNEGFSTPCWLWQGHCDEDGYAEVKWRGHKYRASRISYTIYHGKLAEGTDVDHLCRNRSCVNPAHLEQLDPVENRVVRRNERMNDPAPF